MSEWEKQRYILYTKKNCCNFKYKIGKDKFICMNIFMNVYMRECVCISNYNHYIFLNIIIFIFQIYIYIYIYIR